jgi:DNA polymerase-3 subunit gamma/tau
VTTALYRRYRPEAFGEMIGQSQVTEPLMTALRTDRVGHAYLFSGPRGCGKTTSARILARCLNCAQGPTDTPCGDCESCVELGRGGGGSLDVVEIDAASHNGVDDARDLRERAVFAPARDRYKIFILDEAHMVTPQGFNALLKLVEEPPDHVKFIFATTEPEKVIGTIRSRTHHYPFRLVPPAAMLEYVQELCATEGVDVEAGVLPLVVRAGGGSPRDTLSLLDQLIAGSDAATGSSILVRYERAVALLGYTHGELLDEVVDAFAGGDAAAAFAAVDRVVQTGQDPRRFVDDLLERLRDLIVVAATGQGAAAVLRGVSAEDLSRMTRQAESFGVDRLSRTADIVIAALDDMTGATSPRLQLELMIARVLTHTTTASPAVPAPAASTATPAPAGRTAADNPPTERHASERPAAAHPAAAHPAAEPGAAEHPAPDPRAAEPRGTERHDTGHDDTESDDTAHDDTAHHEPGRRGVASQASVPPPTPVQPVATPPRGPVTVDLMRDAWAEVLKRLETLSRSSWLVATTARVAGLEGDVLTLSFQSQADVTKFKQRSAGSGPSEDLRTAIQAVLGIRVKYLARHDGDREDDHGDGGPQPGGPGRVSTAPRGGARGGAPTAATPTPGGSVAAAPAAVSVTDWAVAPIPRDDGASSATGTALASSFAVDDDPEDAAVDAARVHAAGVSPLREGDVLPAGEVVVSHEPEDDAGEVEVPASVADRPVPPVVAPPLASPRAGRGMERYGEAVVRQVLGARFVREEPHEPPTRFS